MKIFLMVIGCVLAFMYTTVTLMVVIDNTSNPKTKAGQFIANVLLLWFMVYHIFFD